MNRPVPSLRLPPRPPRSPRSYPRARAVLSLGLALVVAFGARFMPSPAQAADYRDAEAFHNALGNLAGRDRGPLELIEFVPRDGEASLWMVRAGSTDPAAPAVLVVAGLDGRHLVGSEIAFAHLERLARSPEAVAALGDRTLYVIPRLNTAGPDAALRDPFRRALPQLPTSGDADADGLRDEDRAEDLNGDGLRTLVRVRHPEGTFVADGPDGAFLRPADGEIGEPGTWILLTEGRDDDGDRRWNEEEGTGINLARTFTRDYPWFEADAGPHQAARAEVRAVLDFIGQHPNIAAVIVYGFEDDLLVSPPADRVSKTSLDAGRWGRKPVDHPHELDLPLVRHLGEEYRQLLGLSEKAKGLSHGAYGLEALAYDGFPTPTPQWAAQGGLAATVYYDWGRLALATPVWTPGMQMARVPAAKAGATTPAPDSGSGDEASSTRPTPEDPHTTEEQAFRDWLVAASPGAWLGWQPFEHPDFPGREAQAGGYAPLSHVNPPVAELDSLVVAHQAFLDLVLNSLPRVRIREAALTALGGGVHELSLTVENTGLLPDRLAQGVVAGHVRPTRVEIELPGKGAMLGGPPRFPIARLEGAGGSERFRKLLRLDGKGKITLRLISDHAGGDVLTLAPGERIDRSAAEGENR